MAKDTSDDMPKPEPIWVAFGIVIAAIAIALGRRRRPVFFQAIRDLSRRALDGEQIVPFGRRGNGRIPSYVVRAGVAAVLRVVSKLDDGERL